MSTKGPFTLAIASGKGGTGKTLVASNLAVLAAREGHPVTLVDCDVEAPNDHLFLSVVAPEARPVDAVIAHVDTSVCTACGACSAECAFGAIRVLGSSAMVFDELCHGCGLCTILCPMHAVTEVSQRVGEVVVSTVAEDDRLALVTGRLDVGQTKSPTVITAARDAASHTPAHLVILDAPPGVACSAVAAIRDANALLLVTEPTPFGLHDLELSLRLGRDLGLPMGVLVNRATDSPDRIEALSARFGAVVVGRIPFDRAIAEIYARGGLVSNELPAVHDALNGVVEQMQRNVAHGMPVG